MAELECYPSQEKDENIEDRWPLEVVDALVYLALASVLSSFMFPIMLAIDLILRSTQRRLQMSPKPHAGGENGSSVVNEVVGISEQPNTQNLSP